MKIIFKQGSYNSVAMTLSPEELDTVLDNIGMDQIENIAITIKIPAEADNGEED